MTLERIQVTWCRWDPRRHREVISHPWVWIWTDSEDTQRTYETKREALAAMENAE